MNTRIYSLSAIADRYDVEKRTVQNWLKLHKNKTGVEVGEMVNGTRLLSEEEVQVLGQYRKPKTVKPEIPSVVEIVEPVDLRTSEIVEFHGGTFDIQAAIANLDGALGSSLDQAEQIVQTIELITDKVASGLEAKVVRQKQELEATQGHLDRVEAAQRIFKRRTTIAAAESKAFAKEQSANSKDLEHKAQEVFDLGKPSPS